MRGLCAAVFVSIFGALPAQADFLAVSFADLLAASDLVAVGTLLWVEEGAAQADGSVPRTGIVALSEVFVGPHVDRVNVELVPRRSDGLSLSTDFEPEAGVRLLWLLQDGGAGPYRMDHPDRVRPVVPSELRALGAP